MSSSMDQEAAMDQEALTNGKRYPQGLQSTSSCTALAAWTTSDWYG